MLRVTHFFHYTSSSHSILRSNLAAIFACLSACRLQLASQFSQSQFRASSYIYIYIYIPPLSDIWFIPTSIVSHPLPLFVHNRHKKNRTSIHREYYYISFFSFLYIYILFSSYKHVFLPIIYLQFARDVASRAVNSNLGGGIYRPPRYLSIYLSSFDSRFRLSFVFFRTGKKRKRNDERTASARDSRAEKRIRESINTEKRSQTFGVFAVGGKRVGKGEGERRTRERSDEKRENAAARVSRKFHYFTLFPSWSTTLFTAFISFFHRFT